MGGGLVLGGGANSFQMGLNPEIIKSFTPYLDGGLAMNIYYELYNSNELSDIRSRNFRLGIGAFTRIWPIESFFIQVQPEYNYAWIKQRTQNQDKLDLLILALKAYWQGLGMANALHQGLVIFQ